MPYKKPSFIEQHDITDRPKILIKAQEKILENIEKGVAGYIQFLSAAIALTFSHKRKEKAEMFISWLQETHAQIPQAYQPEASLQLNAQIAHKLKSSRTYNILSKKEYETIETALNEIDVQALENTPIEISQQLLNILQQSTQRS